MRLDELEWKPYEVKHLGGLLWHQATTPEFEIYRIASGVAHHGGKNLTPGYYCIYAGWRGQYVDLDPITAQAVLYELLKE